MGDLAYFCLVKKHQVFTVSIIVSIVLLAYTECTYRVSIYSILSASRLVKSNILCISLSELLLVGSFFVRDVPLIKKTHHIL